MLKGGVAGAIDLGKWIDIKGVIAPSRDEQEFAKVRVHPEPGTVVWLDGADLDPDVLYASILDRPTWFRR